MLFNPTWDFHSLVGLRDWMAKQPADDVYVWAACSTCVVGKYLQAHGEGSFMYGLWLDRTPGAKRAIPESFSTNVTGGGRTTMGEALERLDAWMAKNTVLNPV